MRVFILGSGFSRDAKYPLTNELIAEFEDYVQRDGKDYQTSWQQFKEWREGQLALGGSQAHICSTENPEYILTYLDIASMAFPSIDEHLSGKRVKAVRDGEPSDAAPEDSVRFSLLQVMSRYFTSKHLQDKDIEPAASEEYGRFFNSCLRDHDIIVTFNYDALAERFLLRSGKWELGDGYGFRPDLERGLMRGSISNSTSTVTLLKLHGSVGWRSGGSLPKHKVTLTNNLLQGFGLVACSGRDYDNLYNQVMLAPSFVKMFEHRVFYNLWSQAAQALRDAEDVVVVGYSLPEADAAAVALVTGALKSKRSPLLVVGPAADDLRERYEVLTGGHVSTVNMGFAKWADDGFTGFPPAST
jgi:hypothetical protein